MLFRDSAQLGNRVQRLVDVVAKDLYILVLSEAESQQVVHMFAHRTFICLTSSKQTVSKKLRSQQKVH